MRFDNHTGENMTHTDELLMILDLANAQGRLTDQEYCRAVDLIIGDAYPIEWEARSREYAEREYNVNYADEA